MNSPLIDRTRAPWAALDRNPASIARQDLSATSIGGASTSAYRAVAHTTRAAMHDDRSDERCNSRRSRTASAARIAETACGYSSARREESRSPDREDVARTVRSIGSFG